MGVSSGFNALVFASILGLLFAVYRLLDAQRKRSSAI